MFSNLITRITNYVAQRNYGMEMGHTTTPEKEATNHCSQPQFVHFPVFSFCNSLKNISLFIEHLERCASLRIMYYRTDDITYHFR